MASNFGGTPPGASSYMFIDGANMSRTLAQFSERYAFGAELPIEWDFVRGTHRKVFYYDAIPVQLPDEDETAYMARIAPKREELSTIEKQIGFHVRTGDVRNRRKRGNEQKMVDVQLAVDALLMASRGLFSAATLVVSDLDFKPLVTALVDMGVDVDLLYAEGETNSELIAAADSARPLRPEICTQWLDHSKISIDLPRFMVGDGMDTGTFDSLAVNAKATWTDASYGRCIIIRFGDQWRLVTDRLPEGPFGSYLEVACKNLRLLRRIIDEERGIAIPELPLT
jgi:uncharacterized LabA/DUF88 family protein